jgi:hypothetical protein
LRRSNVGLLRHAGRLLHQFVTFRLLVVAGGRDQALLLDHGGIERALLRRVAQNVAGRAPDDPDAPAAAMSVPMFM